MASGTLIVREAVLAVNGAGDIRREPHEHLRARMQDAAAIPTPAATELAQVLSESAGGDDADPGVLQALLVLSLVQPAIVTRFGFTAVNVGRRLAARLERDGETDSAMAILELLAHHHPNHRAVERDLAALMRRQGMVQDLVTRYIQRANKLIKLKRNSEAIASLREVLMLDRSRKDVARTIRDLRYREMDDAKTKRKRFRLSVTVLTISLGVSLLVLREKKLLQDYAFLPASAPGELDSMRVRLSSLDLFHSENPFWHRSLQVIKERSQLKADIESVESSIATQQEEAEIQLAQRLAAAEQARQRGIVLANSGDFQAAIAEFQRSLDLATADWGPRERVERDLQSIHEFLKGENP